MIKNIYFSILTVETVAALNKGKEILEIKEETSEVPLHPEININIEGIKELQKYLTSAVNILFIIS